MKNPYKSTPIKPSEITPYSQYLSRRAFLKAAAIFSGSALLGACAPKEDEPDSSTPVSSGQTDEFGDPATSFDDVTHYNNYYEVSENKEAVVPLSKDFKTKPWTVEVYGLVNKPKTFGI